MDAATMRRTTRHLLASCWRRPFDHPRGSAARAGHLRHLQHLRPLRARPRSACLERREILGWQMDITEHRPPFAP
jgi:hypothetical protein